MYPTARIVRGSIFCQPCEVLILRKTNLFTLLEHSRTHLLILTGHQSLFSLTFHVLRFATYRTPYKRISSALQCSSSNIHRNTRPTLDGRIYLNAHRTITLLEATFSLVVTTATRRQKSGPRRSATSMLRSQALTRAKTTRLSSVAEN